MPWFDYLLNSILPPRCPVCGQVTGGGNGLCPECFNQLTFITEPYCRKCGHPFEALAAPKKMLCPVCLKRRRVPFRLSRSAVIYDEASKPLLLGLKFHDKTDNTPLLGGWLSAAGEDIFAAGIDVIIPVPLHYLRLIKRRYNQAALLAKEVGRLRGLPVDYQTLCRCRHTKPQTEFSGHQRIHNVKDAFAVRHIGSVTGKRILLIDDVLTTGSTLRECAEALRRAGALSVDTLTVARVI